MCSESVEDYLVNQDRVMTDRNTLTKQYDGPDGFALDGLIANLERGHGVMYDDHAKALRALHELRDRRAVEPPAELEYVEDIHLHEHRPECEKIGCIAVVRAPNRGAGT